MMGGSAVGPGFDSGCDGLDALYVICRPGARAAALLAVWRANGTAKLGVGAKARRGRSDIDSSAVWNSWYATMPP